jgi:hypothetical protein
MPLHGGWGSATHVLQLLLMGTAAADVACSCFLQDARYNPVRAVLKAVPPRGAQKYDMLQVRALPQCVLVTFLDICCSVSTGLLISKLLFGTK